MNRLFIILLSLFWTCAAGATAPVIVDGAYLVDALKRNVIVWDVRPADAYAKGHIPGAVNIGDAAKVLRDDNTEDFIPIDRIEKLLGAAGLDLNREIVVYGSRGTWNPYFGLYAAQYLGGEHAHVYHEGIEDWAAAGRAVSREAVHLPPVALKVKVNPSAEKTSAPSAVVISPARSTFRTSTTGLTRRRRSSSHSSRLRRTPECHSNRPRT